MFVFTCSPTVLDRFHWVIYLQHQLVAFVDSRVWPSTVVAVSVSSYIGPTVINDPARVPEHEFLTVSTGVKVILADLGSTCNVLLSPAVLTLFVDWDQYFTVLIIQSLVVTPAQFFREQDTGISHIPHDLDLRLIGFILISEILCLGLRQLPCRFMLMITFDLSWADTFKFFSQTLSLASTRFSACCSLAVGTALSFVHGFWGPGPWLFSPHGFSGPFPGCFYFFTATWHVFQPAYNSPPWSESQRCPRSLHTAS